MSLVSAEIREIARFLQVQIGLSIMLSRVRVPPGVLSVDKHLISNELRTSGPAATQP